MKESASELYMTGRSAAESLGEAEKGRGRERSAMLKAESFLCSLHRTGEQTRCRLERLTAGKAQGALARVPYPLPHAAPQPLAFSVIGEPPERKFGKHAWETKAKPWGKSVVGNGQRQRGQQGRKN